MSEHAPAQMLAFAGMQKQGDGADPMDQVGQGLLALVQQAANISKENADRAMSRAHKLAIQLRAAEDRIAQLQEEVDHLQTRATRAEQWLENEIEEKLIA